MPETTTKMAPVTASTRSESRKMESAGVEDGAKIFVGLMCIANSVDES